MVPSKIALDKHKRYKVQYKPNDLFWGIGIELETYFQFQNAANMNIKDISLIETLIDNKLLS
jgi:hypothetical protein